MYIHVVGAGVLAITIAGATTLSAQELGWSGSAQGSANGACARGDA
jgi:hypothetical protein